MLYGARAAITNLRARSGTLAAVSRPINLPKSKLLGNFPFGLALWIRLVELILARRFNFV